MKTLISIVLLLVMSLSLSACSIPEPDEAASVSRMGRFIGLVSRCQCSNISTTQILNEYTKILGSSYSAQQVKQMRGYIDVALSEHYSNQTEICLEVCAQDCKVNTIAEPLGGKTIPDVQACPITERGLLLTVGRYGRNR